MNGDSYWRRMGGQAPAIISIRGMIIRVSDQLRCGEISLFEVDQEEAEAAKARLEAKRAQRRESHTRNKEKINAKRRQDYAQKQ